MTVQHDNAKNAKPGEGLTRVASFREPSSDRFDFPNFPYGFMAEESSIMDCLGKSFWESKDFKLNPELNFPKSQKSILIVEHFRERFMT